MLSKRRFEELVEQSTRRIARHTSRRGFLGRMGAIATGTLLLPLLPVDRRRGNTAEAVMGREGWLPQHLDPGQCNYWRHCALDGQICDCCGGSIINCPPGTTLSPSSWVASCLNPEDGQSYLIAYRDCCGKSICPRCGCYNTVGVLPMYRPEYSSDIIWCFGAEGSSYHCTIQPIVGKAEG
jgi:methylamine dehydrogenase light chain